MWEKELEELRTEMSKTTTQIVREQYNTILALRKEGYNLKDILEGFKRKNIFPANLTYQRLVNILAKENKLRGIPKGKIQTHDTKKGEVTAAPIPSPAPSASETQSGATATSAPSSPLTTNSAPAGARRLTDEEIKLRRIERAKEEEKRRARVQAMREKEEAEENKKKVRIDPRTGLFTVNHDDD